MDSESGPPSKRFRSSLAGNVQLAECVRQFKLPRQYPSMVQKKLQMANDNTKLANVTTNLVSLPKTSNVPKIIESKKLPINAIRTIKLKGKDGRDLGQVNVQDLPINIQGKTITITKNGVNKSPTAICTDSKMKVIPDGNLTPLKTEDDVQSDSELTIDTAKEKIISKNLVVHSNTKKLSCKVDPRPQVLLLRSCRNWQMIKLPQKASSTARNTSVAQSQPSIKSGAPLLRSTKDSTFRKTICSTNLQVGTDSLNSSGKKILSEGNQRHMVVRKLIQSKPINSDRVKIIRSTASPENGEQARPKIEISRIIAPSSSKSESVVQNSRFTTDSTVAMTKTQNSNQQKSIFKQDVMSVLPVVKGPRKTNGVGTIIRKPEGQTNGDVSKNTRNLPSSSKGDSGLSSWRRKLLANRRNDLAKYGSGREISSPAHQEKKNGMSTNLSILEKALSSVEDEVLREKALQALAECGIGIERLVPVCSPSEQKPVKDSDTQTTIFGLWDDKQFIHVPKEFPTIQRIPITERTHNQQQQNLIVSNPDFQDFQIAGIRGLSRSVKECTELTEIVEDYVKGNDSANRVAAIFADPCPVQTDVVEQLQKDFEDWNKYDENGYLNIHNAVISDSLPGTMRHLMVLSAREGSADIPTRDGETSLELAIRHDASPKIVKLLLDAGAEPTAEESGHDTALLIACKKSNASLVELVGRVKSCESLNSYDSEGFAALHYCAQNGNEEGVKALIRASADINLPDRRSGRTALFHAIENDYTDLGQILLENGAEANKPNYGGQTIFHIIEENKHYNLLEVLNRLSK
ncbi:uncharacterized protein [Venturia canescens]|uniref:uncharacterized protein n=1 Tax=Venturia canescens TaxID=32260 RepID=UPI001C9D2328|nr:uncharacterized protein LOC122419219 [Venturia canescens]